MGVGCHEVEKRGWDEMWVRDVDILNGGRNNFITFPAPARCGYLLEYEVFRSDLGFCRSFTL